MVDKPDDNLLQNVSHNLSKNVFLHLFVFYKYKGYLELCRDICVIIFR